ncbi:MAG: hypothetical protein FWG10_11805 [Eubacteriaceae bacterium]|nr:hypothetical protein [Eubacteriaceae bacterium]
MLIVVPPFDDFSYLVLTVVLFFAYKTVEKHNLMEVKKGSTGSDKLEPVFWIYNAFTFFSLLGFAHFALIGYHLRAQSMLPDIQITFLYSATMAIDAVVSLIVGILYDRIKKIPEISKAAFWHFCLSLLRWLLYYFCT